MSIPISNQRPTVLQISIFQRERFKFKFKINIVNTNNMQSLIQPILESYPKYVIEKQTSPSYVEMYTRENKDLIIVYAKVSKYSAYLCRFY